MSKKDLINIDNLPKHIAIIMDGNGRWAKQKGKLRVFGHKNGVKSVRAVTEACAELGVKYLTLYAFSTENWGRPKFEVNTLMNLLLETIHSEISTLQENKIRLNAIGDIKKLPIKTQSALANAISETSNNKKMVLNLALNYSGRWELIEVMKKMIDDAQEGKLNPDKIDDKIVNSYLQTAGMPDPELLIRTSGEIRLSNYLLWQVAYSEFYFTEKFWPDFEKEDLYEAILSFQNRIRRFGKTDDQIV